MAERRSESVASSAIEYAAVTERVALRVAPLGGAGTPERAYSLAMETLRRELAAMPFCGRVAILREERLNERGEVHSLVGSPGTLNVGDTIGTADPNEGEVDLAIEPIEGLTLLARGQQGSIAAIAAAPRGTMLRTPDMYMSKLIVGPNSRGKIDIDAPVSENIQAIAEGYGRKPSEITVAVLERERHEDLVEQIRATGARIQLRQEGDLTPAIAVGLRGAGLHAIIGIGGA
ncbi:MAG: fructose-bisphosphatase class II, partial [Actinomycetota bacterium]|nr:fructose-bisphosphatase class II [Actinomycetota bacterium]